MWLVLKVVLLPCSSSVWEHIWSIEDWIHSKRTTRLGQELVECLVCDHTNLKLEQCLVLYEPVYFRGTLRWRLKRLRVSVFIFLYFKSTWHVFCSWVRAFFVPTKKVTLCHGCTTRWHVSHGIPVRTHTRVGVSVIELDEIRYTLSHTHGHTHTQTLTHTHTLTRRSGQKEYFDGFLREKRWFYYIRIKKGESQGENVTLELWCTVSR